MLSYLQVMSRSIQVDNYNVSPPHTPPPLGRAGITEGTGCMLRGRCLLFLFYFYFPVSLEVAGFDSPPVQGAGVSVSVITATAVSRYAPIRFPSVTHITRPLAGPLCTAWLAPRTYC